MNLDSTSRLLLRVEGDGQNPQRLRRWSSSHAQGWSHLSKKNKNQSSCVRGWRRRRIWAHDLQEEWCQPKGQTVRSNGGVAHVFGLIPVSVIGEGAEVGGGVENCLVAEICLNSKNSISWIMGLAEDLVALQAVCVIQLLTSPCHGFLLFVLRRSRSYLGIFQLFEDQFRHQALPQDRQCLAPVANVWMRHSQSVAAVPAAKAACCVCLRLLSVTFGGGRGVGNLSNSVRSPFFTDRLLDATCWHRIVQECRIGLRLPKSQSLFLRAGQFYPKNSILGVLLIAVVVHLSWHWRIVTVSFFIWICPQKGWVVWGRWFVFLPCFLFRPATSPVSRVELALWEQPLWKTNSFQWYGMAI